MPDHRPHPAATALLFLIVVLLLGTPGVWAHGLVDLNGVAAGGDPAAAKDGSGGGPLIRAAPAPVAITVEGSQDRHNGRIVFKCPEDPGSTAYETYDRTGGFFTVPGCPLRIVDVPNPLSSPALAVRPDRPEQMAFFSLHGKVHENGPTDRSRTGDTHTTFTGTHHGARWADQPIGYEDKPPLASGEHASGAIDNKGNIYVGMLWHLLSDTGNATNNSTIALVKAPPTPSDTGAVMGRPMNVVHAYSQQHRITVNNTTAQELHLTRVDLPPPPSTNETETPPQNGTRAGDYATTPPPSTADRVVATWAVVPEAEEDGTLRSGYVDATWSTSLHPDDWTRLNATERIGPCIGTGKPAAYDGRLFVPCIVGPGYDHRPLARIGEIDMWSLDPMTGETKLLAYTGLDKGHPIVAATTEGFMGVVASGMDDGQPHARYVFGFYGTFWRSPSPDIGTYLHRLAAGGAVKDARVTAFALLEDQYNGVMIYHERRDMATPNPFGADPNDPPRPNEYAKTVLSFSECSGIIAASSFTLGDGMMAFHQEAYQRNPGVYNDLQDGLVTVKDKVTQDQVVHFAVNDYGSIQYGTILGDEATEPCHLPPPPPPVPAAPALPTALQTGTGMSNALGAAIGLVASAMIAYLLTVKRRNAMLSTAEDP